MNLAETHDLLRLAASFDNRRFDDATVISWQQVLDDLPFADAQAGVLRHFRDSDTWLMPVHVRRLAEEIDRERRRAQRERLEQAAIEAEAADPTRRDRSPEVQALLDDVLGRIGPGRPEALRRPEWLENDKRREREARAESNPAYTGPPPTDGWPLPEQEAVAGEALPVVPESAYPPDATPLADIRADIDDANSAILGARGSVRAALAKLRELREPIPNTSPTEAAAQPAAVAPEGGWPQPDVDQGG